MLAGVNLLANAVSVTLGPKGRNVIIEQGELSVSLNAAAPDLFRRSRVYDVDYEPIVLTLLSSSPP